MWLPSLQLLPLELLLDMLIKQYLSTTFCISFVIDASLTFHSPVSFIFLNPDEEILVKQILKVSEMGCSDYIVLMKEPQKFMSAFERVIHLGNVRRSNRKIIFLPHDVNLSDANLASKVFSLKGSAFVGNILMVTYSNNSDQTCVLFDMITHTFVGTDDQVHTPLYLDRWNSCTNQFENQSNLFPHDMKNLHGKTLKVATFNYKPYSLLNLDTAVEPLGRDGIEIRIVNEFCRWINCTIEIIQEEIDQWGEVFENETDGVGIIGSVVADRADMALAGLCSWYEEWRVLDFSASVVRTAITCIAPAPRLLSSWDMPLMPFTWYLWVAVIFTFFYCSIGLLIAEGFNLDSHPFLTVFGMMIGQSQFESGVSWKVRRVTGWLLILGSILSCAYGVGLAATFTVPTYEPSIDTIQDIVDRRMIWSATHDAWIFSLTSSKEPLVKQLVSQFRTHSFDELKKLSFTRSIAFGIEKLPAGNFAIQEYLTKEAVLDMMVMLEDFYHEQVVIMMRKSSPYTEKISQLVGRLHQSGLLLAWETQVALKHLNYKVQLEVRLSRSKNSGVMKALNASNVVGIYMIYLIGVVLSTSVFIGEHILHHRKIKKRTYLVIKSKDGGRFPLRPGRAGPGPSAARYQEQLIVTKKTLKMTRNKIPKPRG